jgi:hypothetical protein
MSIKDYKQIFQQWGLSDNPFAFTPPDEFAQVAKIFHGRSQELEIALPTLYEGRNVLIRGKWGIGKTALIKTLLHQLQQEVVEMNETMLVLYLGGIPKPTVINYLNSVRQKPIDSIEPFTNEVLDRIIEAAQGTPRQLNNICEKFLRQAAMKKHISIDLPVWETIWNEIQTTIMRDLSPRQQQLLYIAAEQKGLSEDISNPTLERLNALTYTAILPEIQQLESMDLIVRVEDERGIRYIPSKLYLPPSAPTD